MSFAQPLALLFLGLFVPVILLYLLKQRRRRVQVSSLLFWDKILRDEQTVTSITKLKKILSLLLQLLFIALLSFALARPLFSERLTGARRIVLFVDTSASMQVQEGDRQRFDLAREKALEVVQGMSIGDTAMLVKVGAAAEIVEPFTDSKRDLREAILALEPGHGSTDFAGAMRMLEQLGPDERETDAYLITDGAFEPVEVTAPRTRFAYLRVGEETENVGITAFQVRPLPSSPRDFQIHLELLNQAAEAKKVPVELRIGGRLVDAYEFEIPPGQTITRTLRQFSEQGGEIEVVADHPDPFPLDNRAYASLPSPAPIKVRLVMEANLFLESALLTDPDVELQWVHPDTYSASATNDYQVTIFSGWAPERVPPGNSIFIAEWPGELGLEKRGALEKPLFTEWERDHPINRHLALKNITISQAAAVRPNPDSGFVALARSFDDPLVLLRESGGQKTMVVTFDTLSTDLPLRVAFPILIANAIRYLAGSDPGERWQAPAVGEILGLEELRRFLPPETRNLPEPLAAVIDPENRRFSLLGPNTLVAVDRVGIYRGEDRDGSAVPLFAANLASRAESTIAPSKEIPLRSKEPIQEIKGGFRLGFEPWFYLVLVGLLLSATEWALFHRRVIE